MARSLFSLDTASSLPKGHSVSSEGNFVGACTAALPVWILKSSRGTELATLPMWISVSSGMPVVGHVMLLGSPSTLRNPDLVRVVVEKVQLPICGAMRKWLNRKRWEIGSWGILARVLGLCPFLIFFFFFLLLCGYEVISLALPCLPLPQCVVSHRPQNHGLPPMT